MTEDTHSYEGRAYQTASGQWAWEITQGDTPIMGGGGYDAEDEARQDMYAELERYVDDPQTCMGCKYHKPGDCTARTFVDGWYRFPDGNCYEAEQNTKPEPERNTPAL